MVEQRRGRFIPITGTTAQWEASTRILALGERGYDSTLRREKIGDGVNRWINLALPSAIPDRFEYVQAVPSSSWTINHNLGGRRNVEVLNDSGVAVWARVEHVSDNRVVVSFSQARTGRAIVS